MDTHDYNDNELQAKMAALRANSSSDRKYKNPDDFYDAVEKHGAYTNSEKANMWNDYQKGKDFEQVVSQHSKPMEIKFSPSVNSYNDFKKKLIMIIRMMILRSLITMKGGNKYGYNTR